MSAHFVSELERERIMSSSVCGVEVKLRKEMSQIRKASRLLRDPGTTSSWRSPHLVPATATATATAAASSSHRSEINNANTHTHTHTYSGKKVFLYNWKNPPPRSDDEDMAETSSFADDSFNGDYAGQSQKQSQSQSQRQRQRRFSSSSCYSSASSSSSLALNLRRRDANLVPKLGKRVVERVDALSKYCNEMSGDLASYSCSCSDDGTLQDSNYSNSETQRHSRLLLRLQKHSNVKNQACSRSRSSSKLTYNTTPALSAGSFNRRYSRRNPSTLGSWDATTASLNGEDDDGGDEAANDDHLDLPARQGCGIPCYWSKRTPRRRGAACGGCYSPSFSDTLRKGTSLLCGATRSQTVYPRRRRASLASSKRRAALTKRSAQGLLPLLSDTGGGSSLGTGRTDDELSTNFGELDLEGLSRLDGRRWSSSCRSHDGLEIVALSGEGDDEEGTPENCRSFSHKYRPLFFRELIGQSIVVQSLINAISRGRIAPVYLFQGPRGTGKTSAARIFASALNCLAPDESKPCGDCRECMDFVSGKSEDLLEVDGTDKRGIFDRIRHILLRPSASSRYKVMVIDECHLLSSKAWVAFLKFLEEPPQRVVFIFITTDPDNVPRSIQSRCQRYLFNKIKDSDIVARLRKISSGENLDVEPDALDLIALNADGSLRDAETMLEQLSLLGKRISKSLVNELVGVVSDEKLLELLELAMSSDNAETVKRARELMDLGVDPTALMTQLASLIMDIIAGTYNGVDTKRSSFFGGTNITEAELERLNHALKLLSEAQKQLRTSGERSTWFTVTLLQLGSMSSPDPYHSGSSRRQSYRTPEDGTVYKHKSDVHYLPPKSSSPAGKKTTNSNLNSGEELSLQNDSSSINSKHSHIDGGASAASCDGITVGNMIIRCINSEKLDSVWAKCIEKCHSKTLRQLLHAHGRLVSISDFQGVLIAYIAFSDENVKNRAERFLSSITNSLEMVLRCNIEVRIILLPGGEVAVNAASSIGINGDRKPVGSSTLAGHAKSNVLPNGTYQSSPASSELLAEGDAEQTGDKGERRQEIPMQRIESIIREQRLETAWLQAVEKGTPGSLSRLKPEKNQVLPQEGSEDQMDLMNSNGFSSRQWGDELNHELKVLKGDNENVLQKDQIGRRVDRYPMSPSLLHNTSFMGTSAKDNLGYESGSGKGGCSGFLCWNSNKTQIKGKVRRTTPVGPRKGGRFSLFGECGKPKKSESRFRR